jgi:ubiquinone/menaquinone biosynthesis C-methylase UbiE
MSASNENCCDFAGNYDLSKLPEIKRLEESALGSDYGGTSWTTRQQVDAIVVLLELGSESSLLDIGSGSGWPGLLLAELSQCNATLLDIPLNALRQAAERATKDQMTGRVQIVSGSGTLLPFAEHSFDRISHSDVLCCLPEKFEMLKEARRVAKSGARMHFSVILPADNLPSAEYEKVLQTGPPFVGLDGNYPDMLRESGWKVEDCEDVTEEYKQSLQRLVDGIHANVDELSKLLGAEDVVSKRKHREDQITLIVSGSMRRDAYLAIAD